MELGVFLTVPVTPSFPWPPKPTGHLTAVALPTWFFHSSLTLERKSVQLIVDLHVRILLVVFIKPLGIHGKGESGSRPSYGQNALRQEDTGEAESNQKDCCDALHAYLQTWICLVIRSLACLCYGIVTIRREFLKSQAAARKGYIVMKIKRLGCHSYLFCESSL